MIDEVPQTILVRIAVTERDQIFEILCSPRRILSICDHKPCAQGQDRAWRCQKSHNEVESAGGKADGAIPGYRAILYVGSDHDEHQASDANGSLSPNFHHLELYC